LLPLFGRQAAVLLQLLLELAPALGRHVSEHSLPLLRRQPVPPLERR
jgi:hypothetical protein